MTMPHHWPSLDDVMETEEHLTVDRREHGKAAPRPDDDELELRTEIERREVGVDDGEDDRR